MSYTPVKGFGSRKIIQGRLEKVAQVEKVPDLFNLLLNIGSKKPEWADSVVELARKSLPKQAPKSFDDDGNVDNVNFAEPCYRTLDENYDESKDWLFNVSMKYMTKKQGKDTVCEVRFEGERVAFENKEAFESFLTARAAQRAQCKVVLWTPMIKLNVELGKAHYLNFNSNQILFF
jgi:hypothetical protein